MSQSFVRSLYHVCSTTLHRVKPSNLFTVHKQRCPDWHTDLQEYWSTLETKDTTKRTHLVGAKLSDNELARLRFICEKLNVTQSEYIREAILTAKVTRPTVVTAMDRDTAKELLAHFGKATSNLNQISRVLNQGYPADTGMINEIRNCIQQMLRGLLVCWHEQIWTKSAEQFCPDKSVFRRRSARRVNPAGF